MSTRVDREAPEVAAKVCSTPGSMDSSLRTVGCQSCSGRRLLDCSIPCAAHGRRSSRSSRRTEEVWMTVAQRMCSRPQKSSS